MGKIITNGEANSINSALLTPINKCPTLSELKNTDKFTIAGSYATNQLVQKEHVSKKVESHTYGLFVLNTPVYATYDISFSDGKRFNGSTSTMQICGCNHQTLLKKFGFLVLHLVVQRNVL